MISFIPIKIDLGIKDAKISNLIDQKIKWKTDTNNPSIANPSYPNYLINVTKNIT